MNKFALLAIGLFAASWLLSLLMTRLFISLFGGLDFASRPKRTDSGSEPVPPLGGAAIFSTVGVVVLTGILFMPLIQASFWHTPWFYSSIAFGAGLVFAVGLYDDVAGASISLRLGVEAIAAGVVLFAGQLVIDTVAIPFVGHVELGVLAIPVTLLWIVGVTNALNLIDGLDGLAGGVAFIACFGVFAIAFMNQNPTAMVSLAIVAGACLGFLKYNSHPAEVFLGDSGALVLGFLLACISVDTSLKRSTSLALLIPMQMLAVPLIDMVHSMIRRLIGEMLRSEDLSLRSLSSMFESDTEHIHHVLVDVGFDHPTAVWILYFLTLVAVMFGLLSAIALDDRISMILLIVAFIVFVVLRRYGGRLPFMKRWTKTED